MAKITTIALNEGAQGPPGAPSVTAGSVALTDGQFPINVGGTLVARNFNSQVAAAPTISTLAVNVKAAGAVGDGVADDTTVLTACVNAGGQVYFPNGTYRYTAALKPATGTMLIGESRAGTVLSAVTADAGVKTPDPATPQRHVVIAHLEVSNGGTTPIGIDGRGYTRFFARDCIVYGFAQTGIRLGTDGVSTQTDYAYGWTGAIEDCEIDACPRCILFGANANDYDVIHCSFSALDAVGSIAVDITGGTTGLDAVRLTSCNFQGPTKGYGVHLGPVATSCTLAYNRFEDVGSDASVTTYPVQIDAGSAYHHLYGNDYTIDCRQPWVHDDDPVNNRTVRMDHRGAYGGTGQLGAGDFPEFQAQGALDIAQDIVIRRGITVIGPSGSTVFQARRDTDANLRMALTNNASLDIYDPSTGAYRMSLGVTSFGNGIMAVQMADSSHGGLAMGTTTALPSPSASWANVVMTLQGGSGVADKLYVCLKNPAGTYTWNLVATGA